MTNRYHHLVFGPEAIARQRVSGSYAAYGAQLDQPDAGPVELGTREISLLTSAFQFHMSTVTPSGWPYVQYKSGPRGFVHHLGGSRIGFCDFAGNNQFVTAGNIENNGRVSLFVADFPRKLRLKLFGRAQVIEADADPDLHDRLTRIGDQRIAARTARSMVIDVETFDWNCSRSLVPQYDRDYITRLTRSYADEINQLRAEIAALKQELTGNSPG